MSHEELSPAEAGSDPGPVADLPHTNHQSPITNHQSPRRAEIDAKQEQIDMLLLEARADALLLTESANIAWFTGAPLCQDIPDPVEWPALWLSNHQRWLVASSLDSQRFFDVHLDGLGFQLKEWPWHQGRELLLTNLCQNRRVARDRLVEDSVPVGPTLRRLRCHLTDNEQTRLRELGAIAVHALEATCRNLDPGQTEAEVAGHLAHRLLRHGAQPVALTVAADGRGVRHRRPGVTEAVVHRSCHLAATATSSGLHVTAARTVCFGPPEAAYRHDFDAACRIQAALAAAGSPGMTVRGIVAVGQRVAHLSGHDEAWRLGPPGYLIGWLPVERPLTVGLTLEASLAVVWQAGIESAQCADTFLVAAPPECVTLPETWPVKRVHIQGLTIEVPDLFVR